MRTSTTAAALFLAVSLAGAFKSPQVAPELGSKPQATAKSSAADYGYAICSTADILTMVGRVGPLYSQPRAASQFIQGRIAACKSVINKYIATLSSPGPLIAKNPPGLPPLPAPTPQTTSPPGCSVSYPGTKRAIDDKPILLYSALTYCTNWIAKNMSAATSTPTPQPIGFHTPYAGSPDPWNKAIYVMALTSDPVLSAQISLQLANNLRDPKMNPHPTAAPRFQRDIYSDQIVKYIVIAAPGWTLAQYQQQCFNDPSTAGALVAVQPSAENRTLNLFYSASTTVLNMQLMAIDCEPTNTSYLNNAAYITWLSHVRAGKGTRVNINLATLLAAGAIYAAFQSPKVTTYAVVRPSPKPSPGSSYESMYTVSSSQGTEATTYVGVASALGNAAQFGEQPSGDSQSAAAIKSLLPQLVDDLMWPCSMNFPEQSALPQPQCFWFNYRPSATPKP